MFRTTPLKVEDSTLSIGRPLPVSFRARAGIFGAFNVRGEILPGEGYEILSQPQNCIEELKRGDTVLFVGQIMPTKNCTWKVELSSICFDWYGREYSCPSYFYIDLSDTLNRAYTSITYITHMNIFNPKHTVYEIPRWNHDLLIQMENSLDSNQSMPDSTKPSN